MELSFKEQKWPQEGVSNEETRGTIILLFYTEDATMKQTLNRACPTAQRLATSAREYTGTLQSQPFNRKATSYMS